MTEWFDTSRDHVLAELERLAFRLRSEAQRMRQKDDGEADARFRGLYASDDQIDDILEPSANGTNIIRPGKRDATHDRDSMEAYSLLEESIRQRKERSRLRGVALRLDRLAECFGLSAFEVDSLLLCLLPDAELKYGTLFGYVQDDMTKKRPTVDTAMRLLCPPSGDMLELRQSFHASAPLLRYGLVRFADDRMSSDVPFMGRQLQIDARIADYLLGFDSIDDRLLSFVKLLDEDVDLEDAGISEDSGLRLAELPSQFKDVPVVLYLQGDGGTGRRIVAEALSRKLGKPLLVAELGRVREEPLDSLIGLVFREAWLQGAIPYFESMDRLFADGRGTGTAAQRLEDEISAHAGWVILSGGQEWKPSWLWEERYFFWVDFPLPTYATRQRLWQENATRFSFESDVDLDDLSKRFRLNAGQIRDALLTARNAAIWRSAEHAVISQDDIYAACRMVSRPGLSELAQKVVSSYGWQDIVLPREQLDQLREICSHVRYHQTVYGEWGFGRKLARGKGLNALFAGVSGTGKTMAAEIMAGELGFDLYKIDLSAIVSKYIGETEKNLDRIFKEAHLSNAILFFDEADAIFGKRSEVRDSHDRYANVETAYLLQKMEDYDGVVILATNLRKNMDDAFARRMHFTVEFPMPEEEDRRRIWESIFPAEAPIAADADLSFMARQFKISGGNIRNIAVAAAFLAAADGGAINMQTLVKATKREYQKIGKLSTEGDFAQYFEVVKR